MRPRRTRRETAHCGVGRAASTSLSPPPPPPPGIAAMGGAVLFPFVKKIYHITHALDIDLRGTDCH